MIDQIQKLIRSLVRPIVTVAVVVGTLGWISAGVAVPEEWWVVLATVITFWFATRPTRKEE